MDNLDGSNAKREFNLYSEHLKINHNPKSRNAEFSRFLYLEHSVSSLLFGRNFTELAFRRDQSQMVPAKGSGTEQPKTVYFLFNLIGQTNIMNSLNSALHPSQFPSGLKLGAFQWSCPAQHGRHFPSRKGHIQL
ncbi:hypothetical protein GOODEAATRI_030749 [Goodea atripinnis]|uniref:Uncharacterized protein n=1 Tax=Goodea atripinnis TaxID=208336 RepID=A0ABV0NZ84_9TELE